VGDVEKRRDLEKQGDAVGQKNSASGKAARLARCAHGRRAGNGSRIGKPTSARLDCRMARAPALGDDDCAALDGKRARPMPIVSQKIHRSVSGWSAIQSKFDERAVKSCCSRGSSARGPARGSALARTGTFGRRL